MIFTLANFTSFFRVLHTFILIVLSLNSHWHAYFYVINLIVIFAFDGLDGYLARKLKQASKLGSQIDIWADRIIELSLTWLATQLNIIDNWIFSLFVLRSIIIDFLGFENTNNALGSHFLRTSKTIRISFAVLKMLSFCSIFIFKEYSLILFTISLLIAWLRAIPKLLIIFDRWQKKY